MTHHFHLNQHCHVTETQVPERKLEATASFRDAIAFLSGENTILTKNVVHCNFLHMKIYTLK
jgi:hypothetical protein